MVFDLSGLNLSWEIFPLLVGFVLGYAIYHYRQYRLGGVIVIPLLAIYTIKNPYIALTIVLASIPIFVILEFLMERRAIYGRRLLYISLIFSVAIIGVVNAFLRHNEWYALLLPGLMAYNYHRENHSDVIVIKSILMTLFVYLVCVVFAWASFVILR